MHHLTWLFAASLLFGGDEGGPAQSSPSDRAGRIAERIQSLECEGLEIHVEGRTVEVSGVIRQSEDARGVLDAILQEKDVRKIQLNLTVEPEAGSRTIRKYNLGVLNWLDQFENTPFGPKTRRDRLESIPVIQKRRLTQ